MIKIIYKVEFGIVHSEVDNYENGCNGYCNSRFIDPIVIKAESLERLFDIVAKQFRINKDDLLINACDELGRLDIQTYTKTLNSLTDQSKKLREGWENGDFDLYLNNISGYVTVEATNFDLEKAFNNEQMKGIENNAIIF